LRALVVPSAALGAALFAAFFPPASALPLVQSAAPDLALMWSYFCSMLLAAAPFLACGAVGAAALATVTRRSARSRRWALPLGALLFPGCDCSLNAYAPSLRAAPSWLAACAIVWASCCNPLALVTTATVLGPTMLRSRLVAGAAAAALTAFGWSRLRAPHPPHACDAQAGFWDSFVRLAGTGIASFGIAAALSAVCLAVRPDIARGSGPLGAALAGALLSPCSSADAVLARVLFERPGAQLVFMVTAQCCDIRQIWLVMRCFGVAHAVRASCAALAACAIGYLLASR
jgi:uncharacterized membrane protein YraQ (UPF0718 family)